MPLVIGPQIQKVRLHLCTRTHSVGTASWSQIRWLVSVILALGKQKQADWRVQGTWQVWGWSGLHEISSHKKAKTLTFCLFLSLSVRPSVHPSIHPSIHPSSFCSFSLPVYCYLLAGARWIRKGPFPWGRHRPLPTGGAGVTVAHKTEWEGDQALQ